MYRIGLLMLFSVACAALAQADEPSAQLIIRSHKFIPAEVEIPAGVKATLIIKNEDPTPEEFESDSLRREKVVAPGQSITVYVGPLKPGTYEFYGDFHPDTARGRLTAK